MKRRKKKQEKRKEGKKKSRFHPKFNSGPSTRRARRGNTMREAIIFYLKPFPIELPLVRPFKHEFKDIFQENDWCFDGKKLNLNAFRRI